MQSLHSVFFFSFTFLTNLQNDIVCIKVLIWYNLFNLNVHMIDMWWCTQVRTLAYFLQGAKQILAQILSQTASNIKSSKTSAYPSIF